MLGDYVGGKPKVKATKNGYTWLVTALTCLQLAFAVYATILLYYMSPSVDLATKLEFTWATRIARNMKQLIIPPHVHGRFQEAASFITAETIPPITPSQVCEYENHFKRKTLCSQLDSLLQQSLPFHQVWVLSFGSPNGHSLKRIIESYNDSRINFISSSYDFKYCGSIGRILPFRQKDFTFPSYRKFRSKEVGLYLPDPAYDITVQKIVQVDFLSIDPTDKETWGDSEQRLAYVSETTVIFKDKVQVRDEQWWRALTYGYVTQWATMYPQKIDAIFYAHSVDEVKALAPLLEKFRSSVGKKPYIVVSGGTSNSEVPVLQAVYYSFKGLIKIHNPSVIITVTDIDPNVQKALKMASETNAHGTALVLLPRPSDSKVLWMADLRSTSLQNWNQMRISINIITQNRAPSLTRLLKSLSDAYYIGDEIPISFNMDSKVDEATIKLVDSFQWPHGPKTLRRRIIQGGLIRAVSESWYPTTNDDYGLLLEDDIEVSPYYLLWIKYALLAYHYDPQVSFPELSSISLYTSRLVEVVKERPRWNATEFFKEFYVYMNMRFTEDAKANSVQIPKSMTNGWQASWKKFLIGMMYLRGYISLYPNFPNQASFSTNHMEPGAHISAKDNVVRHDKADFKVPLLVGDFRTMLPNTKLPPASKLPSLNLFNQPVSLKGLKAAGAKLGQDVLRCNNATKIVTVDHITGLPLQCSKFI
ncbi:protein-tyrosine sulfotransferase-like [Hibiscus syriacus]|uniref:Protein-tyrosine sulfotransferase-like n=1 Tax=Hibiscus syriacus TaxID=106335 RepID=A0A6A2XFX9_HIBSY|nr:protein-tyrosine sulfotransferase-like [Hibiscus syriacus]